ncbi:MAG: metallophosphoesterase [Balneolales bacterium]|nr:metallophosphoesterase [Balneolales bacterium]
MYDFIGDIHGHADALEHLLKKMGYTKPANSYFRHPERKAFFVGDFIDRGPDSRGVVEMVKSMQENNAAMAIMGNHEYNALCYHTFGTNGDFLRKHSAKNNKQHKETLRSYNNDSALLAEMLDWFYKLPLYYEADNFRAVHACWNEESIRLLDERVTDKQNAIRKEMLPETAPKGTRLYDAVEIVLKGKEVPLPPGVTFQDKDGHPRDTMRLKWWEAPEGKTFAMMAAKLEGTLGSLTEPYPESLYPQSTPYDISAKPVFFGHYWLNEETPEIQKTNVCCLDYSIAKKGKLTAYRFDGEARLSPDKLVWVS